MKSTFSLRRFALDTLFYVAGSALYAMGLVVFAKHANFAPGGVSGIALLIHHFTGLPIGVMSLVLNIPLVLLCLRVVGTAMIAKSLWPMLLSTVMTDLVFPLVPAYQGNAFLAAVFTGVGIGAGLGLIYMRGASTGGVDFLAMSIKKLRPHFSMGQINLGIDFVVILAGGIAYGNIDAILLGIIATFAASYTTDNLLLGIGSSKLAIIITTQGQQIANAIDAEVGRGSTLVPATGAYTGQGRDMLLCICSKSEIYKVRTAARAIDPGSMVVITEASEVFGEGFAPPPLPGNEDPHAPGPTPPPSA